MSVEGALPLSTEEVKKNVLHWLFIFFSTSYKQYKSFFFSSSIKIKGSAYAFTLKPWDVSETWNIVNSLLTSHAHFYHLKRTVAPLFFFKQILIYSISVQIFKNTSKDGIGLTSSHARFSYLKRAIHQATPVLVTWSASHTRQQRVCRALISYDHILYVNVSNFCSNFQNKLSISQSVLEWGRTDYKDTIFLRKMVS